MLSIELGTEILKQGTNLKLVMRFCDINTFCDFNSKQFGIEITDCCKHFK